MGGPVRQSSDHQRHCCRRSPPCDELVEASRIVTDTVRLVVACAGGGSSSGPSPWTPTVAFGNRYEDGSENVGYHSDFLMSLGPRPVIAGLNLGAARVFRLRSADGGGLDAHGAQRRKTTTVSIPACHNSLIVMKAGAQESWYHAVPQCSNSSIRSRSDSGLVRYSLTFRMERPNFSSKLGGERCHCGGRPVLKCSPREGTYYLCCNPAGGSAAAKCRFWTRCKVADEEARRLRRLEHSRDGLKVGTNEEAAIQMGDEASN